MSKKGDAVIKAIKALIKDAEGFKMKKTLVPARRLVEVRITALKDVIKIIEAYTEETKEAEENNRLYRRGELR